MEDTIKFARKCSSCQEGMNEGYCIDGGINYYCSDDCLHTDYTPEQWDEEYNSSHGWSYWTQWEDEDDYEYELINGILTEIE